MSTYYATFSDHQRAKDALRELLRGGVRPDDASLLLPNDSLADTTDLTAEASVGDATARVGRKDDPADTIDKPDPAVDATTIRASAVSGVDTSNAAYTGDTADQMDDSQSVAEDSLYPYREISNSEHQLDDLALAVTSGFPTPVPEIDDVKDGGLMQDENEEALEALDVPGFGVSLGNGGLATAALGEGAVDSRLTAFFEDDGVPSSASDGMLAALNGGHALLGIVATPGEIDEPAVERIAERNGGQGVGMFDAPRFYDGDATPA